MNYILITEFNFFRKCSNNYWQKFWKILSSFFREFSSLEIEIPFRVQLRALKTKSQRLKASNYASCSLTASLSTPFPPGGQPSMPLAGLWIFPSATTPLTSPSRSYRCRQVGKALQANDRYFLRKICAPAIISAPNGYLLLLSVMLYRTAVNLAGEE